MHKLPVIVIGLGLSALGTSALADDSVSTNAYYRSGINFSKNSSKGTCYRLTGPIIPRWGNECDNYGELMIHKAYKAEGIQFKAHLNLAFSADGNDTWEPTYDSSTKDADLTLSYREAWVEASGVFGGESSLWVGKRFYQRWNMDVWDFFIVNHNGSGFGAENIEIGIGQLDVALLRHYQNGSTQPLHIAGDIELHQEDFLGGEAKIRYIYSQKGSKPNAGLTHDWHAITGHALNLYYKVPLGDSIYQTYLQYGSGLHGARPDIGGGGQTGSTFSNFSSTSIAKSDAAAEASNEAWQESTTIRWTNDLQLFATSKVFTLNLGLSYTLADFGGALAANGEEVPNRGTLALGFRPTYFLSKIWAVDADVFYGAIDKGLPLVPAAGGTAGTENIERNLLKNTLAIVLRPSLSFSAKPQIRFYATHAQWNKAQKGDILITDGNPVYSDSTSGMTYGVQGEVWW